MLLMGLGGTVQRKCPYNNEYSGLLKRNAPLRKWCDRLPRADDLGLMFGSRGEYRTQEHVERLAVALLKSLYI